MKMTLHLPHKLSVIENGTFDLIDIVIVSLLTHFLAFSPLVLHHNFMHIHCHRNGHLFLNQFCMWCCIILCHGKLTCIQWNFQFSMHWTIFGGHHKWHKQQCDLFVVHAKVHFFH